ncbi:conserved hypothetical protein [Gluconacetobacter diazotrophicus PA1 5]|uniref:Uncharacterized protein n=1 Tax=Gluconacetobacter diazotrophicus TaxID=33996 RepID=A0A7W4FCG2_GLUDI|nr:hypothetical protein [Gluconacetobacter diazotrophicus]ACI51257.1 conserved hypothetical protein [Gluconacetobacter diazotrophicus PA1 5]MBB2155039.1 hypothetical protein [Gluconacetobacter diazotrophicus]TWB09805.1 hypothetical protein FBZ86_10385 [Gluconacetobacter diazotrophicus]
MKKLLSALLLLLIIVIVGGLGLRHFAQSRMESAIADLRAAIGPGASFTYATATPRVLARGARLTAVSYRNAFLTVTASDALVGGVTGNAVGGQRIGRVTLHDVQVMEPGATASIGLLVLEGLVLPNTGPTLADPESAAPAPPRLDSLVLDSGRLEGLHVAVPGSQTDLTVARAAVRQYGLGRTSHLDLDSLAMQINLTPGRHITIGHLRIDGPDFAGQIASLLQSGHMIHESGHRHFDVSAIQIDASTPLMRIGHLVVEHESRTAQDDLDTTLTDLEAWPPPPQDQSPLRLIGYDHFSGTIHAVATVQRQNGLMSLHPLDIDAPAMGRMTVLADLDQIPVDDPMSLAETARIVSATIDWHDRSLAGHVLDGLAHARQVPPDAYRQQVISALAASPDISMQALGRFLDAPDRPLRLTLRPPQPLNLLMLGVALSMAGDPSTAGLLGLSISTP